MRSTAIKWQIARVAQVRVVTGNLSDEEVASFLTRLASIAPGMALQIEVDTDMAKATATATAAKKVKAPRARKSKGGRPMVSESGQKLAFHPVGLEPALWAWVRLSAEAAGLTPNRFLRQLILDAKAART